MFKRNGRVARSLAGRTSGTVTVIDARVHNRSRRNARLALVVTALIVGLLSMSVASDKLHPILALLLGIAVGLGAGSVAWVLVRIWPVLRLLWWWTPEILLGLAVVYGWTALARHTILPVRIAAVALLVGVPAAVGPIRRRIVAAAWCVIVRHRLRTCFAQFIIANQSGSLPLILTARPTPVGERVWIYLRPGLSEVDLQGRLDKIAVACHASAATVERASERTAALLRFDIKRREVLRAPVGSPLVDLVDPDTPATEHTTTVHAPSALDLPDVVAEPATIRLARPRTEPISKPAAPAAAASANGAAPVTTASGDDISDWI